MGNDNSKSTIENQQMIMQLQQQLINQQTQQQPQQPQQQTQQQYQPQHQQHHQQNRQHYTPQNNNNDMYNRQLPVISPAELIIRLLFVLLSELIFCVSAPNDIPIP